MSTITQVSPQFAASSTACLTPAQLTTTMYEQHKVGLQRFAERSCRDSEEAQDLVQDAFLRLFLEIQAGRTPDNVRAWLHRVVANATISRARRVAVGRKFAHALVIRDAPPRPEDIVSESESQSDVRTVLATLAPAARTALILAANGSSGIEISNAIGRSNLATRALMSRTRRSLRSHVGAIEFAA